MLDWIYNCSTDTYNAVIVTHDIKLPEIKLSLSHTPKKDFWLLSIDIGNTHSAMTVDITGTGVDINDIDSVKTYVENHAIVMIDETITALHRLNDAIAQDMQSPMPTRRSMATRLYAEYRNLPNMPDDPTRIGVKWHDFSAGCMRHHIEKWFQRNFDVSVQELQTALDTEEKTGATS